MEYSTASVSTVAQSIVRATSRLLKTSPESTPRSRVASTSSETAPQDTLSLGWQNSNHQQAQLTDKNLRNLALQFQNRSSGETVFGGNEAGLQFKRNDVPVPLTRADKLLNQLVRTIAPLSEGNQEAIAMLVNAAMPKVMESAGIDFQVTKMENGISGFTDTNPETGQTFVRVNENLSEQDRALTTIHEALHAFNRPKFNAELQKYQQTKGFVGNPPRFKLEDEVRAHRLEALAALLITPSDGMEVRKIRNLITKPTRKVLEESPYKPLFEQAKAISDFQKTLR